VHFFNFNRNSCYSTKLVLLYHIHFVDLLIKVWTFPTLHPLIKLYTLGRKSCIGRIYSRGCNTKCNFKEINKLNLKIGFLFCLPWTTECVNILVFVSICRCIDSILERYVVGLGCVVVLDTFIRHVARNKG